MIGRLSSATWADEVGCALALDREMPEFFAWHEVVVSPQLSSLLKRHSQQLQILLNSWKHAYKRLQLCQNNVTTESIVLKCKITYALGIILRFCKNSTLVPEIVVEQLGCGMD